MKYNTPEYVRLYETGELDARVQLLYERLKSCIVCPHHCKVDRPGNERGFCRAGARMVIDRYGPHYGEEDVLVGTGGSGTIFFSYCTLQCVFCQNCEISHFGEGYEVSPSELSSIMLSLQKKGCHNINFVSPSHYVPQIVEAISLAAKNGLTLPLVYNTGGYDEVDTLKLLDGIMDIYMPDNVSGTDKVLEFIAEEISKDTFVNIISQYYPAHKSFAFPELSRRISRKEYNDAVGYAEKLGLVNIMESSVRSLL